MVRSFDFVFILQRNESMRKKIYELMASSNDEVIDIKGWHLFFDSSRHWVVITNNGTDEYLQHKFIPAEIEYDSLIHLMDPNRFDEEIEYQIRE